MYNDKNIKNNNQTKICKCCGRELPLSSFAKSGKKIYCKICKSCENKQRRKKREDNRFSNGIEQYLSDDSMHIQRQYKKINKDRILRKKVSGIDFCAKDEKFVKSFYITRMHGSAIIEDVSFTRTVSIDCFVAVLTNGQVILYTLFAKKDTLNILRHMHIRRLKSQGIL